MVEVINLRNYLTLVGVNHMTKHSKTLVNNLLGYSNSLYLNNNYSNEVQNNFNNTQHYLRSFKKKCPINA